MTKKPIKTEKKLAEEKYKALRSLAMSAVEDEIIGSNEKAEMMERMKKHLENTRESFISNLKAAEELNFQGGVMAGPTQSDRLHH